MKITNTAAPYVPVGTPSLSITYLTLDTTFTPGTLVIDTGVPNGGNQTFSFTLPDVQYASIVQAVNYTISPQIYGVNFPTSAQYIQDLGVTMSRWGGNAVTAYNPAGQFTNAGNDWYVSCVHLRSRYLLRSGSGTLRTASPVPRTLMTGSGGCKARGRSLCSRSPHSIGSPRTRRRIHTPFPFTPVCCISPDHYPSPCHLAHNPYSQSKSQRIPTSPTQATASSRTAPPSRPLPTHRTSTRPGTLQWRPRGSRVWRTNPRS